MAINFNGLKEAPRVLMEADLKPLQGDRFQATYFPNLGPALYSLHDGTEILLVESCQSVANRMETVCWDEEKNDLVECMKGLPYVRIKLRDKNGRNIGETTTIQEFHRLNSPYIWNSETETAEQFKKQFRNELGLPEHETKKKGKKKGDKKQEDEAEDILGVLDISKLAKTVLKYDPMSLIHGVFLEKIAGRLRLTRALSGFIEARNVKVAESGGVKFDHVNPGGESEEGYGNVPFSRTEFTTEKMTAYFNLDLDLLRGYRLPEDTMDLLIASSLYKIRSFLDTSLRLRAACDLEILGDVRVTRPDSYELPSKKELEEIIQQKIKTSQGKKLFNEPTITVIEGTTKKKDKKDEVPEEESASEDGEE